LLRADGKVYGHAWTAANCSDVISRQDIEDAAIRVATVIRPTPVAEVDALSRIAGRPLLVKPEHLQRTGSFKIRGAYNLVSRLPPGTEVVAASAGNHAQGVALAAALTGLHSTIYMPANAALPKVEATQAYGATVRLEGAGVHECLGLAKAAAEGTGAVYVPPFDDPLIIAGQGTVGLEIATEAPDVEVVVVPIGGGGLISGVATALAHSRRGVRIVGVEAAGAAGMRASLDAGHVVTLDGVATMADGIAVRAPSPLTLAHVEAYVDDVVTVTEEELSRALLLLLERAKAVVEPAGAAAVAAVLSGKVAGRGPVVAVLSGGNIDPLLMLKVIDHGLSAAGRYLLLRIVLDDRPGALAALTAAVADIGLNVLEVEHHRSGVRLGVAEVEVLLTVETRDPRHATEVVEALRARGFGVELDR
jgi:threonine dehydratase